MINNFAFGKYALIWLEDTFMVGCWVGGLLDYVELTIIIATQAGVRVGTELGKNFQPHSGWYDRKHTILIHFICQIKLF